MNSSHPILNVSDVVELEQRIAEAGTPLSELMHRAGSALADAARAHLPRSGSVCVLCGSGNNGGDGWVAAELLALDGHDVTLVTPKPAEQLGAELARTAALHALEVVPSLQVLAAPSPTELDTALADVDIAIDALLGTGFSGSELREPFAGWVGALECARVERGVRVIAADTPSGVSAQTGEAATPHVIADETVTMMVLKPGLLALPGASACGTLHIADICDLAPFTTFLAERSRTV